MNRFQPLQRWFRYLALALVFWIPGSPALSQGLPSPVNPNAGGAPDGNWLALIRGYIADGATVLGLAIAIVALLWVAYIGIAKFNECRRGRAEWSELGLLGIVAAILLLFLMFLLNQAATIMGTPGNALPPPVNIML